jgi:hypothetical protein
MASAAVRRVEQDMLANLDASEQEQMRQLLTACIAALTEPPAGDVTPPDRPPGPGHVTQAATAR